ncbi:hypothetical protein SO802_016521 [Lithocarpus litseifolius]|uniref:Uncharacterized protein n=1 Tax=Lithocarpus litseifolius TaxID=425828 RepID=A0AAW2D0X5_9ROSI
MSIDLVMERRKPVLCESSSLSWEVQLNTPKRYQSICKDKIALVSSHPSTSKIAPPEASSRLHPSTCEITSPKARRDRVA